VCGYFSKIGDFRRILVRVRPPLLVGIIRHGCAVVSRRPTPGAKSNGATVANQYDTADN